MNLKVELYKDYQNTLSTNQLLIILKKQTIVFYL